MGRRSLTRLCCGTRPRCCPVASTPTTWRLLAGIDRAAFGAHRTRSVAQEVTVLQTFLSWTGMRVPSTAHSQSAASPGRATVQREQQIEPLDCPAHRVGDEIPNSGPSCRVVRSVRWYTATQVPPVHPAENTAVSSIAFSSRSNCSNRSRVNASARTRIQPATSSVAPGFVQLEAMCDTCPLLTAANTMRWIGLAAVSMSSVER